MLGHSHSPLYRHYSTLHINSPPRVSIILIPPSFQSLRPFTAKMHCPIAGLQGALVGNDKLFKSSYLKVLGKKLLLPHYCDPFATYFFPVIRRFYICSSSFIRYNPHLLGVSASSIILMLTPPVLLPWVLPLLSVKCCQSHQW
ncbi:hypothetical protein BGX38DRAFT_1214471 [Terfezia claveryi]|nr:hypothetical protein BGX38DRAFT_1214471 [Terfezia claveryi]